MPSSLLVASSSHPEARSGIFAFQFQFRDSARHEAKLKISPFLQGSGRAEGTDPLLTYCPLCPRGEDGEPGDHTRLAWEAEPGNEFLFKFCIPARESLPGPMEELMCL